MKTFRQLTSLVLILLTTLFFSCSMIQEQLTTELSLDMAPVFEQARDMANENRAVVSVSTSTFSIQVKLIRQDGSEEKATVTSLSELDIKNKVIVFDDIPLGEKISIELKVFQDNVLAFIGSQNNITVDKEETVVNITLTKITDLGDKTPPEDITELNATVSGANVLLTWIDSVSTDIYGYEVSWGQAGTNGRSAVSAPLKKDTMMIPHGNEGCYISNLSNNTTYNFTVKAIDTSGNASNGVSTSAKIEMDSYSPLQLTLTVSTKEITKNNVTVNAFVSLQEGASLDKLKYVKGIVNNANALLDDESAIDITSSRRFSTIENGTYSVACQDNLGRREISYITISNIDITAPAKVQNFIAKQMDDKIQLTWSAPTDEDVKNVKISIMKDDVSQSPVTLTPTQTSHNITITEEEKEGVTFVISIQFEDNVGNLSEVNTKTITTSQTLGITSVTLNRTHISSSNTNRDIEVTINGINFDKINEQQDKTIKVRFVKNGQTQGSVVTATIDETNNIATATIQAPTTTSDYNLVVALCGTTVTLETGPVVHVTSEATISSIYINNKSSKEEIDFKTVNADTTIQVKLNGTNLDIDSVIEFQYYDINGAKVGEPILVNNTGLPYATQTITQDIAVPQESRLYTLKVLINGNALSSSNQLHLYDDVSFESFTIQKAGTQAEYETITAKVKGRNFKAPGVTASDFAVSCDTSSITSGSASNISIIDDETLQFPLTICSTAGEYGITISKGSASKNQTFVIQDYTGWQIGDVIQKNGTKIDYNASYEFTEDDKTNAVAVICGFNKGVPLGMGLTQSTSTLRWAPDGTTGYSTNFKKIQSKYSGSAPDYIFSGDLDGSDNWNEVCLVDPEGSDTSSVNYPAFNFASTYAATAGLLNGSYNTGWYLPAVAELYEVYKNKDIVNAVLTGLGATQLRTESYWSSSQYSFSYSYAYYVDFSSGAVSISFNKDYNTYVLVLRAF